MDEDEEEDVFRPLDFIQAKGAAATDDANENITPLFRAHSLPCYGGDVGEHSLSTSLRRILDVARRRRSSNGCVPLSPVTGGVPTGNRQQLVAL